MAPETHAQPTQRPIYSLSQELIDAIIDAVFNTKIGRAASMKSCSLVSKAFQSRSQMHLFSRIRLSSDDTRTATLLQMIEKRPTIADYIQEMYLLAGRENSSWLEGRDLFKLMDKLAASRIPLRKFALVTAETHTIVDRLEHLMDRIIQPYFAASITTLRLEGVKGVPLQLLSCFINLRTLRVVVHDDMPFTMEHIEPHYSPTFRPSISTLKFAGDDRQLSTVASFLNLADLRHLIIDRWNPDPISEPIPVQEVINGAAKGSLESVGVVFSDEPLYFFIGKPSTFLDLSNQPELHTLNQAAIISQCKPYGLNDVSLTLQTISTPSRIQPNTNTLHLNFVLHCVSIENPEVLYNADWDAFASEISRISTMRPVKLSLAVSYWYWGFTLDEEEHQFMKVRFTEVLAKVVDEKLSSFKSNVRIILFK